MASGPSAVVMAPAPAHAARASVATAHERKNRPAMSASLSRDVIVAAEKGNSRAVACGAFVGLLWAFCGGGAGGAGGFFAGAGKFPKRGRRALNGAAPAAGGLPRAPPPPKRGKTPPRPGKKPTPQKKKSLVA